MKSVRITWGVLTAGSLLAGLFTGWRECFLLFFILAFVALFSLLLNLWTVLAFSFVQELDTPAVVKGSPAGLRLSIHNDKPFPFTLMRLTVDTPAARRGPYPAAPQAPWGSSRRGGFALRRRARAATVRPDSETHSFSLLPKSSIKWHLPLPTPFRGVYPVGMRTLVVNDIFGLVRTRFDMRSLPYYRQPRLKVYPRLVALPALPARGADMKRPGGAALFMADDGDSYSDLRAYRPGDALKRVHRTATARRGELLVKRYEVPMETAVLLALDPAVGAGAGAQGPYLQNLACECAAAIAHYCLRAGFPVLFVGAQTLTVRGMKEFGRLYNELAVMEFDDAGDAGALSRGGAGIGFDALLKAAAAPGSIYKAAWLITQRDALLLADTLAALAAGGGTRLLTPAMEAGAGAGVNTARRLPAGVRQLVVAPGQDLAAALGGMVQ